MKITRKPDKRTDDAREFTNFAEFTKDRSFITTQVALKISCYDNKGDVMLVDTPSGSLRVEKGDIVVKDPAGFLSVLKPAQYETSYRLATAASDIEEEMATRARICGIMLDYAKSKGYITYNKLEQMLIRFAGKEIEKTVETKDEAVV